MATAKVLHPCFFCTPGRAVMPLCGCVGREAGAQCLINCQLADFASPVFVIINYENSDNASPRLQAPANLARSVCAPADRGTQTSISVTDCGLDVIEIVPFTSLTRSCMLMSPSP
jgi:hypothetical protein